MTEGIEVYNRPIGGNTERVDVRNGRDTDVRELRLWDR
jgi:hypothetical protein